MRPVRLHRFDHRVAAAGEGAFQQGHRHIAVAVGARCAQSHAAVLPSAQTRHIQHRTRLQRHAGPTVRRGGGSAVCIRHPQQHRAAVAQRTRRTQARPSGIGAQHSGAGQSQLALVTGSGGLARKQLNAPALGAACIQLTSNAQIAVVHGHRNIVGFDQACGRQAHITLAHPQLARLGHAGRIQLCIQGIESGRILKMPHIQTEAALHGCARQPAVVRRRSSAQQRTLKIKNPFADVRGLDLQAARIRPGGAQVDFGLRTQFHSGRTAVQQHRAARAVRMAGAKVSGHTADVQLPGFQRHAGRGRV